MVKFNIIQKISSIFYFKKIMYLNDYNYISIFIFQHYVNSVSV
jgi:hypothetical protein